MKNIKKTLHLFTNATSYKLNMSAPKIENMNSRYKKVVEINRCSLPGVFIATTDVYVLNNPTCNDLAHRIFSLSIRFSLPKNIDWFELL